MTELMVPFNSIAVSHYDIDQLLALARPEDIVVVTGVLRGMMGVTLFGHTWTFKSLASKYKLYVHTELGSYKQFIDNLNN